MSVTKEVHRGTEEVFAIDTGHLPASKHCDSCMYYDHACATIPCAASRRADGRSVYFLPITDLKGQLLFHTQDQLCPSPSQSQ